MDAILEYATNIILALVIFFVGKWIVAEVTNIIVKVLRKKLKTG